MLNMDFLKKIYIFQDLSDEELRQITELATPHDVPQGQMILTEGKAGDSMFILCQGEVEITKRLTLVLDEDTPKEKLMIRLKAEDGAGFGEMALLENEVRSATVTALTDCQLLELHREDFLAFIHRSCGSGCKVMVRLAQLLSRYLRKSNQDVVKLTTALAISLGG